MPYPEYFIAPMRAELADVGVQELRSSSDVDQALASPGTVMIVVNSVCGCAAGKARPGIVMALEHERRPDVVATVFAGADIEATERARHMLERRQIETRDARSIAAMLMQAFDEHCQTATA
jgi:putative YphP/YqiW family bacilliredoxin